MLKKYASSRAIALLGSLVLSGGLAKTAVLFDGTITILNTDPTQLGRITRDTIDSDWSFQKTFPGVFNPATSYHYETVSVVVPNWLSFVQISIDSNNGDIFGSAYDSSYNPLSLATNYMGDAGGSGNFFGNPLFFQVVDQTAANSATGFANLIVVLNETTTTGTGRNSPVGLLVEGFSDTAFDEFPEPVTSTLMGTGIVALAVAYRRRGRLPSRNQN